MLRINLDYKESISWFYATRGMRLIALTSRQRTESNMEVIKGNECTIINE